MTNWSQRTILAVIIILFLSNELVGATISDLEIRLEVIEDEKKGLNKEPQTEENQVVLRNLIDEESRVRQELALLLAEEGGLEDGRVASTLIPITKNGSIFWPNSNNVGLDIRLIKLLEKKADQYPVLLARLYFLRVKYLAGTKNLGAAEALIARALPHCQRYLLDFEAHVIHRNMSAIYGRDKEERKSKEAWKLAFAHLQRFDTPTFFGIDLLSMRNTVVRESWQEGQDSWFGLGVKKQKPKDCSFEDYAKVYPIHDAVERSDISFLTNIVKRDFDGSLFLQRDNSGEVTLHKAVRRGDSSTFDFVCQRTPRGDYRNQKDNTPLHFWPLSEFAKSKKRVQRHFLRELVKRCPIDGQNNIHFTPLHVCAEVGLNTSASLLLEMGANYEARDLAGRTPLHCAATCGKGSVVKELASAGAKVNCRDILGMTPLHIAALIGDAKMVALLVELGADREARDNHGLRPIDCLLIETQNREGDADRAVSFVFCQLNKRSQSLSWGNYEEAKRHLSKRDLKRKSDV